MIIIQIKGGLGNQMFQYALGRALSLKFQKKLFIDTSKYQNDQLRNYQLSIYNIEENIFNHKKKYFIFKRALVKVLAKLKLPKLIFDYYVETSLAYDNNIKVSKKLYLEGFFQNEKYFLDIREQLLKDFTICNELSSYTKKMSLKIASSKTSISLHIRRGDYITDTSTSATHGVCELSYYHNAIKELHSKFNNIEYFIFSDDIVWVKENLKINNATYISSKEVRLPHEDIYLMSICNHNIIANSSFSWWGAWLNNHKDKIVIAPKRWFINEDLEQQAQNIVCKDWIRL